MNTLPSKNSQQRTRLFPIALFCGLIGIAQSAYCLETASQEQLVSDLLDTKNTELFEYIIDGRSDPFVPFISDKAASTKIDEILPTVNQLTGMQLFEPGQLNLVAIVMAENNDFAMAEDTTGKGYILRTGMEIGQRGIITAIQANEVIIEETAFTRAGKKLTSNIVMLLKKEGEE